MCATRRRLNWALLKRWRHGCSSHLRLRTSPQSFKAAATPFVLQHALKRTLELLETTREPVVTATYQRTPNDHQRRPACEVSTVFHLSSATQTRCSLVKQNPPEDSSTLVYNTTTYSAYLARLVRIPFPSPACRLMAWPGWWKAAAAAAAAWSRASTNA